MLLVLLIHCCCECSCFEINSMTKNFNSVSPFLFAVFRWKLADVSRTEGVSHDAYIFVSSYRLSIVVPSFIIIGYVWHILGRRVFLLPTICEQPRKGPSWIGLRAVRKWLEFFHSKVAGYKLTKKGIHQRFFPVKFVKLFRAVFNQSNFWQMILYLPGLYEILPVFSTQWQYFFDYTMTIALRNLIKTMIIWWLAKQINIPKKVGTFLEKYPW